MSDSTLKRAVLPIATISAFAGLGAFVWWKRDEFSRLPLTLEDWPLLALCTLGSIGNLGLQAYLNLVMFNRLGGKVTPAESYHIGVVSIASNLLIPMRGGLAMRAMFLKHVCNVTYADYSASILGYYVLNIFITCFFAAIGLIPTVVAHPGPAELLLISAMICGAFLALVAAVIPTPARKGAIWSRPGMDFVHRLLVSWNDIRSSRRMLRSISLCVCLEILFSMTIIYGSFRALGVVFNVGQLVSLTLVANLATLLAVTPGALGTYELVLAFMADRFGVTPALGVAASLIGRGALILCLVPSAPISFGILTKRVFSLQQSMRKEALDEA